MSGENELKEGDFVFPTNDAVEQAPQLKQWWRGGTIKEIRGGVVEVSFTIVETMPSSMLTKDENAFDPIL